MFIFDQKNFFDAYRQRFGPLTQPLVEALEFLIGKIEGDTRFGTTDADRRQIAYCLATFKWETAGSFEPIDEHGSSKYFNSRYGPQTKVGKELGNTESGDGALFHGRGFVQLTGRANYRKASKLTGTDLVAQPDAAKDPDLAYQIAVQGMLDGWFTGKKLSDFIQPISAPDFENARRIINKLDHAADIASIARKLSEVLLASTQVSQ